MPKSKSDPASALSMRLDRLMWLQHETVKIRMLLERVSALNLKQPCLGRCHDGGAGAGGIRRQPPRARTLF